MSRVVKEKGPRSPKKLTRGPHEEAIIFVCMSNAEAWLARCPAGKVQDLLDLATCMETGDHEIKSNASGAQALPVSR